MYKFHIEFDLDESGEMEEGDIESTPDELEKWIVSELSVANVSTTNFKITKKEN